jgi:hypothetical protein
MDTPEFLVWAIEYACPIRGFQDGSDPERTERQLRAARAVSDARREGRVFEGLCVDPPNGFRIDEGLAIYGGQAEVKQACGNCPANAIQQLNAASLAGCYGIVPLPLDPSSVHTAVERGTEIAYPGIDWSGLFPVTTPRWYGLWLESPLEAEVLLALFLVLEASPIEDRNCRTAVNELLVGINVAFNAGCRLHVALYPRGHVAGPWWRLTPHCPRCKAEWLDARSQLCCACSYEGHPAPDRKRHARGIRPYFPLDRLLGAERSAEFLSRYEAFRKQQGSPDRE